MPICGKGLLPNPQLQQAFHDLYGLKADGDDFGVEAEVWLAQWLNHEMGVRTQTLPNSFPLAHYLIPVRISHIPIGRMARVTGVMPWARIGAATRHPDALADTC